MMHHILIAEDEAKLAQVMSDYLLQAGMQVTCVDDGAKVIPTVTTATPDLLLLDLMLPNEDGLSICRELRQHSRIPIIMVTAKVEEVDRLLGLELGADDYICKPFSPREVVARVKSVLRRVAPGGQSIPDALQLDIDPVRFLASIAGKPLDLTPVEFKLLEVLAKQPGRVYRRQELLELIYDDFRDVSDRTIDSHVRNLRRKLEAAAPDKRLIHSVYGIGYKLTLEPNA